MKFKYRAKDYPTVTRGSYKDYTHVVIVFNNGVVFDKSFNSRLDLAEKRKREFERHYLSLDPVTVKWAKTNNCHFKIVISEVEKY